MMHGEKRISPQRTASRHLRVVAGLLLFGAPACLFLPMLATPGAQAQQTAAKVVEGKVFTKSETALSGVIVYLQDQKSNVVKTFITTPNGSYRFGQLPADTDYKIWARYKDQQTKAKLISSFDTRLDVTQDFHIGK